MSEEEFKIQTKVFSGKISVRVVGIRFKEETIEWVSIQELMELVSFNELLDVD